MKKIAILLTNSFPFGNGENFIDYEIKYLASYFTQVVVCPYELSSRKRYDFENMNVLLIANPRYQGKIGNLQKTLLLIMNMFSIKFFNEIITILKSRSKIIPKVKDAIKVLVYSGRITKLIVKELNEINITSNDQLYFYSYWLSITAFSAIELRNKYSKKCQSIAFSRAHGHDLYEYRKSYNYLPFREYFYSSLDFVFPVSYNGYQYILENYPYILSKRIKVMHLGTPDYGGFLGKISKYNDESKKYDLHIVSCSSMIPVKRLHYIVEALCNIHDIKVLWTHIGDGPLYKEITEYSRRSLKKNITTKFTGHINHNDIVNIYSEQKIDLFINSSESEGLPVSIMEAASFGIPIIAPDVGGVSEIVTHDNGYLMDIFSTPLDYSTKILNFSQLSLKNRLEMEVSSRRNWEKNFSADDCFPSLWRFLEGYKKHD